MKCPICGVEVGMTLVRVHREAEHPDYVQWVRHKVRLTMIVIFPSWAALIVVDTVFGRFLAPHFLFLGLVTYAIVGYAVATVIVIRHVEHRKLRELREVWKQTHPPP
jgi:hypothetical protein